MSVMFEMYDSRELYFSFGRSGMMTEIMMMVIDALHDSAVWIGRDIVAFHSRGYLVRSYSINGIYVFEVEYEAEK